MPVFKSEAHPGTRSAAFVFGRAVVKPLSMTLIPVMTIATSYALTGRDPLAFAASTAPVAILLALAWTQFRLRRQIVEIRVHDGFAACISTYQVLLGQSVEWKPVYGVRITPEQIHVAIDRQSQTLQRSAWPEHETLIQALQRRQNEHWPAPARANVRVR